MNHDGTATETTPSWAINSLMASLYAVTKQAIMAEASLVNLFGDLTSEAAAVDKMPAGQLWGAA